MKVILMQELKGKGGEGDVIDVAQGFFDNYLFPNKIAIKATKGNLKQLEQRMHNIQKREATRIENAEDLQKVLSGKVVTIITKVGEEGQLFGSVTPAMISEGLKEQFDLEIDRKRIDLSRPIKTAGTHTVVVSIYREIKSELVVDVKSEEMLAAEAAEAAAAAEEAEKAAADAVDAAEESVDAAEGAVEDAVEGAAEDGADSVAEAAVEGAEALEAAGDGIDEAADAADATVIEAVEAVAEVSEDAEAAEESAQ